MDASPPEPTRASAQPEAVEVAEGRRIAGRFRLVRRLGGGGMGDVWEAFDEHLERAVAVKVLRAGGLEEGRERELFEKESRLLAQLSHPGIVPLHEAGEDDGLPFLVMDLVDGATVSDVLKRVREEHASGSSSGRIVPRDARPLAAAIGRLVADGRRDLIGGQSWYRAVAAITADLAGILSAAHGAGVVHRDLKPGNIMLLGGGEPMVLDFGLAGRLDMAEGPVTQSLTGTVPYMAAEQVRTSRIGTDPRTDVYQLGLILYEFLTLQRAFPGSNMGHIFERIKAGVFQRPRKVNPGVPRDLEAICLKAMELQPANRYRTAAELREDLQRYLEGRDVPLASRASLARKLPRTALYLARRYPIAAAGSLALLAAGATWFGVDWSRLAPQPEVLAAFRAPMGRDPVRLALNDPVRFGDVLGVEIEAGVPVLVYGLTVYGGENPGERRVKPVTPKLLDGAGGTQVGRWALRMPKGRHRVGVSFIDDETNTHEGILVFASSSAEPWLESAFDDIELQAADDFDTPLAYEKAMALIGKDFAGARGGQVPGTLPLRTEELQGVLKPEHLTGKAPWPKELTELKRFALDAPVAGSAVADGNDQP